MATKKTTKKTTETAVATVATVATETAVATVEKVTAENFDFSKAPQIPFTLKITTKNNKGEEITTSFRIGDNSNGTLTINGLPIVCSDELHKALESRETLTDTMASKISPDACKVYRYYLKVAKAKDKKERFEKSGVKFMYKDTEMRFLPKHAIDGTNEFILFKSIDGNATCYLHKTVGDKFVIGVLAKGGKAGVLKSDLVELTTPLLKKLMNDTFNGLAWEEILALCKEVEKFGTCSVPKALK